MSQKQSDDVKFCRSPSVTVDQVIRVVTDTAKVCRDISLIMATKKKGAGGGTLKVTFIDEPKGLLLKVRQLNGEQEVRILCKNISGTRLEIARALRDRDIPIHFKK